MAKVEAVIGKEEGQRPCDEPEGRPRNVRDRIEDLLPFGIEGAKNLSLGIIGAERTRCRLLHKASLFRPSPIARMRRRCPFCSQYMPKGALL